MKPVREMTMEEITERVTSIKDYMLALEPISYGNLKFLIDLQAERLEEHAAIVERDSV